MKAKGSRAERELLHKFFDEGWSCVRSAGSGSIPLPSPDLLAGNGKRYLAIECKSIKAKHKYFPEEEIDQLKEFASKFGAEPWIGVRFDFLSWFFVHLDDVKKSKGKHYVVTLDFAQKNGKNFDELIGSYNQKKLPE